MDSDKGDLAAQERLLQTYSKVATDLTDSDDHVDLLNTLRPTKVKKRQRSFFDPRRRGQSSTQNRDRRRSSAKKREAEKKLWDTITGVCNREREYRFASQNGTLNVNYITHPEHFQERRIVKDFFHTILDAKWRYFMLLFTLSFLFSWILFAMIWYLIVSAWDTDCVSDVDSFATAFLFSIETQVTIGYGGRAVTDLCPDGIILIIIQSITGAFIQSALLGILFAKLSRPRGRMKTIIFSDRAVINLRDGQYCLIFRYMDLREQKLLDSNMRLICIKPHMTVEGEQLPLDMKDMCVTIDYKQVEFTMRLFPIYPVSIIHIIDRNSPLYNIKRRNIIDAEFEIIAILEGTVPGTGNTTEAVASFKSREIKWGERFCPFWVNVKEKHSLPCFGVSPSKQTNMIDLSSLNDTYKEEPSVTPDCSAKQYDAIKSLSPNGDKIDSRGVSDEGTEDDDGELRKVAMLLKVAATLEKK